MEYILECVKASKKSHSEECGRHTLGVWLRLFKGYIRERHSLLRTSSWDFRKACIDEQVVRRLLQISSQESRWLFVSKVSQLGVSNLKSWQSAVQTPS